MIRDAAGSRPDHRAATLALVADVLVVVALALAIAALLTACGGGTSGASSGSPSAPGSSEPATTTPSPSSTGASPSASPLGVRQATVYFLRDGVLAAASRTAPLTPAAAVRELLRGPTTDEAAAGATTAVPRGVRLLSYSEAGDGGGAVVDLTDDFIDEASAAEVRARLAQLVYTVTGQGEDPTVFGPVKLRIDGVPVDLLPSGEGDVAYRPTRRGYRDLEPPIFVETPGLFAKLSSPFTLSGSATVYEGSFVARLVDDAGRRIVSLTVQATRGAPGRGRFSSEVAYSTSAPSGTLIVYATDAADGSRIDEVRVPVTFVLP